MPLFLSLPLSLRIPGTAICEAASSRLPRDAANDKSFGTFLSSFLAVFSGAIRDRYDFTETSPRRRSRSRESGAFSALLIKLIGQSSETQLVISVCRFSARGILTAIHRGDSRLRKPFYNALEPHLSTRSPGYLRLRKRADKQVRDRYRTRSCLRAYTLCLSL